MDISPYLRDLAAISIPVMGIVARLELHKFLKARGDQTDLAYLDGIIDQAAQLGLNQVQKRLGTAPVTVDLHNEVLDRGLTFVLAQAEAEKTRLGFTNADIAQMIAARLDFAGGDISVAGNAVPAAPAAPVNPTSKQGAPT